MDHGGAYAMSPWMTYGPHCRCFRQNMIYRIDNLSLKYVIYLYMYNLLRAFSFSHRLVAYVILFCLSVPPFCDMCICSSRTKGEGRHCSGTIPGIDLFAEVTKTSLTSSRFSVWARLGSPQSMRHDIIIIFCWWTSNDIKCMIMRVCHVSPTCFFGNIILETMNIMNIMNLNNLYVQESKRLVEVVLFTELSSDAFAASWGTTSTISTSTSVTQSSTTTSTTLWWAQLTSRLHKTNSEPNRFANTYTANQS